MPTLTWSHLKPHLQRLEKDELLALLRELYGLNADNKAFLATRLLQASSDAIAEPYRKVVRQVFNPDRGFHDGLIDIYTSVLPTYWEL
jgi:hypothetical protein